MIAEILAVSGGAVLLVVGLIGCVVPVVPGPILAVAALFVVSIAGGWLVYAPATLVIWTTLAVGAQIVDSILPARAAGKAGANRGGVWGSIVGMIAGTVFFPPFGVFLGAFAGAFLGELVFHRDNKEPLKAAVAVFRGTIGGIVLKLAVTGGVAFVFVRGAVRLFG